ncbi:hypothetical protein HF995_13345 [Sanguibacter hominis ATCC BAA-789]|uniref:Uncharacterized protein n=1 Tax=Sanguibacter hominis ATCC BAA-789 TaxID=1312740 RepID=A0A9X5FD15_9MICO|nr:hypothetical protein [Sanguibacter hominis]NKX94241.1 hypothetical protein [Sanguibacter hominis ATCC BAA-789]
MTDPTPPIMKRPRGTLDPARTTALYAKVDVDAKDVFVRLSHASGLSLGVVVERVAEHLERELLDTTGLPEWWPTAAVSQDTLNLDTNAGRAARKSA